MASDHAREAATLVLADLCDRRDISGAIEGCDADTRAEIHESLAAIIRELMDRENQQLRDRVIDSVDGGITAAKASCEADYRERVLRCLVEVDIAAIIAKGVQHDAG